MPRSIIPPAYAPQSPDPTPLRNIAFSVAESALQSDPNSPSFDTLANGPPAYVPGNWYGQWVSRSGNVPLPSKAMPVAGDAIKRPAEGRRLLSVVEKAKERRRSENGECELETAFAWGGTLSTIAALPPFKNSKAPESPPLSPSYNFVLPSNSPLAASIAATPRASSRSTFQRADMFAFNPSAATPPVFDRPTPLTLTVSPPGKKYLPLYTRSAEPSPTRPMFDNLSPTNSTFDSLDRANPPPEFVPRLSAKELSARLGINGSNGQLRVRRSSMTETALTSSPAHRQLVKLPSLAQIQAKVSKDEKATPIRAASPRPDTSIDTRIVNHNIQQPWRPIRNDSPGSIEILQTPTDEHPPHVRILSSGSSISSSLGRPTHRPSTPPSPSLAHAAKVNDNHRLASFLRQRTSGRLASSGKVRPVSMPPLPAGIPLSEAMGLSKPIAAKMRESSSSPTRCYHALIDNVASVVPPRPQRWATPPPQPRSLTSSLVSPTDSIKSRYSIRSHGSPGSPVHAIPTITCTDSDEEEGDVVLFDGDAGSEFDNADAESDEEEREKVGRLMKEKLGLRRSSG